MESTEKSIRELQVEIRAINQDKGWYDKSVSFGELIALIHSEASEALEAYRKLPSHVVFPVKGVTYSDIDYELADIVIRTLDTAERLGIDLASAIDAKLAYNRNRPYRHGNKRL